MRHYTEADLLELHYVPSEETVEASTHVAGCDECRHVFGRLQQKLRGAAQGACPKFEAKPETFWKRQRLAIFRSIESGRLDRQSSNVRARWAVAAAIVLLIVSFSIYRIIPGSPDGGLDPVSSVSSSVSSPALPTNGVVSSPAAVVLESVRTDTDPWSSQELMAFHDVVEWETWIPESPKEGDAL